MTGQNETTETNDARRLELVAAAQRQWIDALTDLGGRNTLLYYKDRRAGTLDLTYADPDATERFEKTGTTKLTRLFRDADARADAIRRMQTIYRKARELTEERGIRAGYLATGLARWDELFLEPAAPVLLRGLTITPTRARYDDFDLTLDDDVEVNPVLLHKLASVFGATIEKPSPERIVAQLAKAANAAEIPGFYIDKRKVIGTFTYAKLPMVRDLEAAGDLLADSDLVAAIAGDAHAQQTIAAEPGTAGAAGASGAAAAPGRESAVIADDPADDYSVLDADSSQRSAIDAVLEGRSLVIHGPPGTGKSQTIANLIAAMVARGPSAPTPQPRSRQPPSRPAAVPLEPPAARPPAAGTPSAGTPSAGTPSAGTPSAGTPSAGPPEPAPPEPAPEPPAASAPPVSALPEHPPAPEPLPADAACPPR